MITSVFHCIAIDWHVSFGALERRSIFFRIPKRAKRLDLDYLDVIR